jgi:hypothetical protein
MVLCCRSCRWINNVIAAKHLPVLPEMLYCNDDDGCFLYAEYNRKRKSPGINAPVPGSLKAVMMWVCGEVFKTLFYFPDKFVT